MKKVMIVILFVLLVSPLVLASVDQAFFSEEELAQARFGNIIFFATIGIIILIILISYIIFRTKKTKKKIKRKKKK